MNDNDIIKALGCCSLLGGCKACPATERTECLTLTDQAYDLVKRQKAEIERLEAYNANLEAANSYICNTLLDKVSKARAEAIKEFAERLKQTRVDLDGIEMVAVGNIDTIIEQMTEK